MNGKVVKIIQSDNNDEIEAINDFCLRHNLFNVAKVLLDEQEHKKNLDNNIFDSYLASFNNGEITDYCLIHGERDIGQCFLSFPIFEDKKRTRPFVKDAIDYTFSLGFETIFVNTKAEKLKEGLLKLGFDSLGEGLEGMDAYVLGKDEKEKGHIYQ